MSDAASIPVKEARASRAKTPIWFWAVAVIATLFNIGGVMNYLVTAFDPQAATAGLTPEQAEYFLNFPAWYTAVYALTTHLSLAGGVLLLFRSRFALHAFVAAAVLYAVSLTYHYVLNDVVASLPVGMHVFSAVIGLQIVGFALFSRWARGHGILR